MKKQSWFKKHEKAAVAGFCAAVLGVTGITAYQLQSVQAETFSWEEGSRDTWEQVTRKERQEMNERIQKKIRELEKYDVTYDSREDAIYYDGRKVRWLVDKLRDGTDTEDYICCVDGEINLYTERNADGELTGVRVGARDEDSFQSEFFDNDYIYQSKEGDFFSDFACGDEEEWEEETEYLKDKYGDVFMFSVSTDIDEVIVQGTGSGDFSVETDIPFETETISDYDIAVEAAEAAVAASETISADEFRSTVRDGAAKAVRAAEAFAEEGCFGDVYTEGDNVLFESLGLKWDKHGYWTYNDKKVKIIWVEDGSFSSYGNVSDGVYLYVRKDAGDGSASFRVEEMTRAEMQEFYQQKHPGSSIP